MFINQTILTRKLYMQFAERAYRRFRKSWQIGALIITVLFAALTAYSFRVSRTLAGLLTLPTLWFLFMGTRGYMITGKNQYNQLVKNYGADPGIRLRFLEDKLEYRIGRERLMIAYDELDGSFETRNFFALLKGEQGMIVMKDGFTLGSWEDFQPFIREKAPQVFRR